MFASNRQGSCDKSLYGEEVSRNQGFSPNASVNQDAVMSVASYSLAGFTRGSGRFTLTLICLPDLACAFVVLGALDGGSALPHRKQCRAVE